MKIIKYMFLFLCSINGLSFGMHQTALIYQAIDHAKQTAENAQTNTQANKAEIIELKKTVEALLARIAALEQKSKS